MGIFKFIGRKMMQSVASNNTVHSDLSGDFKISDAMRMILDYEAKDDKDLLDFALNQAILITNSKIGYIYHYSEEDIEFTLNTWSKEVMDECAIQEKQTKYKLEKTGIWGEVVRQRKPIMINNYKAPHILKKGYPEGHVELINFLSVPVFEGDKIIMVVGVSNKETDYNLEDVRCLNAFMVSVKSILKKFDLLRTIQEKETKLSEELQELQKMNQVMVGRELTMAELKNKVTELEKNIEKQVWRVN